LFVLPERRLPEAGSRIERSIPAVLIPIFHDRSLTHVKGFNQILFASLVMVSMFGFVGCGPDNESEGQKLSTKIGDPGKANPDSLPKDGAVKAPPATSQDRAARGPQGTGAMQGTNYPGAAKK
jgi:hypothetical protein